jgi:hypothetical protein
MEKEREDQLELFQFLIQEIDEETRMKNINFSSLPHFNGLTMKYINTFIFELKVLCITYDYTPCLKT